MDIKQISLSRFVAATALFTSSQGQAAKQQIKDEPERLPSDYKTQIVSWIGRDNLQQLPVTSGGVLEQAITSCFEGIKSQYNSDQKAYEIEVDSDSLFQKAINSVACYGITHVRYYRPINTKSIWALLKIPTLESLTLIDKRGGAPIERLELCNFGIQDEDLSLLNKLSEENKNNLRWFMLSGNRISNLAGFPNFPKLEQLYLSNNRISKLVGFPDLQSLRKLGLSDNQISNLVGFPNLPDSLPFCVKNSSRQLQKDFQISGYATIS